MKLYTEEQVRDMLEDMNYLSPRGIDYYMSEMTPIELPSDEDIIAKSKQEPDNQITMAQYRKKPVIIEAIQFNRNNWNEILEFTNNTAHTILIEKRMDGKCTCIIPTLEGEHIANEGDYIIKGVKGEYYPCKQDIFEMTYEQVNKISEFTNAKQYYMDTFVSKQKAE